MKTKVLIILTLLSVAFVSAGNIYAQSESTRKERNYISEGNKLYNDGRYRAAYLKYQQALKENPSSAVARYNLGLSQIRLGSNPSDTTQAAKDMLANGAKAMEQVSQMGREKPMLASRANYNLGNIAFNSEDYSNALNYYKQSLRLNPDDEAARRNLRITQLKLQNQNQDQNQDQNKDQNQDQNQQQQQNQPDINQQTADQILKAMENKENQTRARVTTGNQGDKSTDRNRSRKNW